MIAFDVNTKEWQESIIADEISIYACMGQTVVRIPAETYEKAGTKTIDTLALQLWSEDSLRKTLFLWSRNKLGKQDDLENPAYYELTLPSVKPEYVDFEDTYGPCVVDYFAHLILESAKR